jgi:phosphoenolpyruvate synthase/pyruvate phosphate dikinase
LRRDSTTAGLINLSQSGITSLPVIGGKAANFAELMKVRVNGTVPLPLPEGAFAIPFFYYLQHLKIHGLDVFIRQMLADSRFRSDFLYRKQQLERLQDSIINSSVSSSLLSLVYPKLAESPSLTQWRFRSSTNSEDIKGFNGAGLYDSFTGIPGDPQKTVERAIKRVWASLWNIGAFEEREYFRIDQNSVAMAVLVHRSFPAEEANGVVITKNLYNELNPGFTINAQQGEFSITNPEGGFLPDEMIWYSYGNVIEYISHSNLPGMEGKTVLSDAEIQQLALYCSAIQSHFCNVYAGCFPVDIEFKIQITDGVRKVYIKQARLY